MRPASMPTRAGRWGMWGGCMRGITQTVVADVRGCTKPVQGVFAHRVVAKQRIAVGDSGGHRLWTGRCGSATMRNHTSTHLIQAALREVLGKHVKQAGSLNTIRSRLRFDFSHFAAVAEPELREVESIVNQQVLSGIRRWRRWSMCRSTWR